MNFDENASHFRFLGVVDCFTFVIALIFFGSIGHLKHLMSDLLFHATNQTFIDG